MHGRNLPIALVVWACSLAAYPFYVLPSGGPQLADLLLLGSIVFRNSERAVRISRSVWWSLLAFAGFATYALIVNVVWSLILENTTGFGVTPPWLSAPMYLMNVAVFAVAVVHFGDHRERFVRATILGLTLGLVIQLLLLPVSGVEIGRAKLFFNNPNQLGYFGLLALCLVLLVDYVWKLHRPMLLLSVAASVVFVLLSLSKGAIVSAAVALAGYFFFRRHFVAAILAIVLIGGMQSPAGAALAERVNDRMASLGQDSDDNAAVRGYDRMLEFPQLMVLGAGEGADYRFRDGLEMEFHSTPGVLLFSYGTIGFLLFLLGLRWSVRNFGLLVFVLMPIVLYGLTHQGLRMRLLWVVLALSALASQEIASRRSRREDPAGDDSPTPASAGSAVAELGS